MPPQRPSGRRKPSASSKRCRRSSAVARRHPSAISTITPRPFRTNEVYVLICDESHRIRETSNSRFTREEHRSNVPQLHELLSATKARIFFIDDNQGVRPNEIGSSAYIRSEARGLGAAVSEYELEVQFCCAGSDGFVNWTGNTLGIRRTANVIWDGKDGFDLRIVGSARELEELISDRAAQGHSARMTAGFCWAWSEPLPDSSLVSDVIVDDWAYPWNARPGGRWRRRADGMRCIRPPMRLL